MTKRPGLFGKLRDRLGKTRTGLVGGVRSILGAGAKLDEDTLEELEAVLIQADVGIDTTLAILDRLKAVVKERRPEDSEGIVQALQDVMVEELEAVFEPEAPATRPKPCVILVAGVNGSGKTTTIGKLAARLRAEGRSVLLGAADTFRAAAADQLEIWGERAEVPVIRHAEGADPAAVAHDAVQAGLSREMDYVIIDTAGRLHTKANLMEELKKVRRVIDRLIPGAPHETLLVLDATTGQNGLQQARTFTEALEVDGIVLTKLDGTAKGGVVIAIQQELGVPVRYIGVGEGVDDLEPFEPRTFIEALFS